MGGDDVIIFLILFGLIAFVSLIISGLIFITEPLFKNDDITLTNPNLGIAKMAIVMSWLSLPITFFITFKILKKILASKISIIIVGLGLITLLSVILYGLSILSMGLFQQDGVYINNIDKFTDPLQPTQPQPTQPIPHKPTVYTDTFTLNALKIATIFSWLSITWNIYFFIKESSNS